MKCFSCEKRELVKKNVEYNQLGRSLGKFDALLCPICEETIIEPITKNKIEITVQ